MSMVSRSMALRFMASIALILAVCVSISCARTPVQTQQIEIINHTMTVQKFGTAPSSVAIVSGMARNNSSQIIEKATITAIFYDDKNGIIATASATIDNLSPATIWNFNIQTTGPDAWKIVNYKLSIK